MSKFNCVGCRKDDFIETFVAKEYEIDEKKLIIEKIPVQKCSYCGEVYFDKEASEYIDNQVKIFRADGLENRSRELAKNKGLTQEQIGKHLDLTKQRVSQIFASDSVDIRIAYKLSSIFDEPIQEIFKLHKIVEKDENKFYIAN